MPIKIIPDGGVTTPPGFTVGVAQSGIKKQGRYDLALILSQGVTAAAGVFTKNKVKAAPVKLSVEHLAETQGNIRGIVVNSGCANACTGKIGYNHAYKMTEFTAQKVGCTAKEILVASTGVIGELLPMEKILMGIAGASQGMSSQKGSLAAQAIMTTDTYAKEMALTVEIAGQKVTLGAMAKGSGMIHPNMATMLGFITTDANVTPACLQQALKEATNESFNMISVDGDTSTNDSVFILANGLAENKLIQDCTSEEYQSFKGALTTLCIELAKAIARDGEGATKLIEVKVINAPDLNCARIGAKSVVSSNLVKAAVFGNDANWGRIICALGYSGIDFDPAITDLYLGDIKVFKDGTGLDFDETKAEQVFQQETVKIKVDLKLGTYQATAWGCDLTYDYVKINGSYRT